MYQHTPGPWEETYNPSDNTWGVCLPEGGDVLAQLIENQADAHLMAAAPAMYLELQNIVEGLTDEITRIIEGNKPDTARLDYLANKAGQAVAQAEGR